MKYSGTKAFLSGVRPCVVAMILATAVIMGLSTLFNFESLGHGFSINYSFVLIFVILIAVHFLSKHFFKKTFSSLQNVILSRKKPFAGRFSGGAEGRSFFVFSSAGSRSGGQKIRLCPTPATGTHSLPARQPACFRGRHTQDTGG